MPAHDIIKNSELIIQYKTAIIKTLHSYDEEVEEYNLIIQSLKNSCKTNYEHEVYLNLYSFINDLMDKIAVVSSENRYMIKTFYQYGPLFFEEVEEELTDLLKKAIVDYRNSFVEVLLEIQNYLQKNNLDINLERAIALNSEIENSIFPPIIHYHLIEDFCTTESDYEHDQKEVSARSIMTNNR